MINNTIIQVSLNACVASDENVQAVSHESNFSSDPKGNSLTVKMRLHRERVGNMKVI